METIKDQSYLIKSPTVIQRKEGPVKSRENPGDVTKSGSFMQRSQTPVKIRGYVLNFVPMVRRDCMHFYAQWDAKDHGALF